MFTREDLGLATTPMRYIDPGPCAVTPTYSDLNSDSDYVKLHRGEGVCVWLRQKTAIHCFLRSAQTIDKAENVKCRIISGSLKEHCI